MDLLGRDAQNQFVVDIWQIEENPEQWEWEIYQNSRPIQHPYFGRAFSKQEAENIARKRIAQLKDDLECARRKMKLKVDTQTTFIVEG